MLNNRDSISEDFSHFGKNREDLKTAGRSFKDLLLNPA